MQQIIINTLPFAPLGVYRPPEVAGGSGDSVLVNGAAVTDANFNDTTPAPSAGRANLLFDRSGSGPDLVRLMTPDSIPIVLDREMTDLSVVNSTTETDILTHSVPANAMGTNRALDALILMRGQINPLVDGQYTLRVYFGGTVIFEDVRLFTSSTNTAAFYIRFLLGNQNATNDQIGAGFYGGLRETSPATGIAGNLANADWEGTPIISANSAIDTTVAQTFRITFQMDEAHATFSFNRKMAILMLI